MRAPIVISASANAQPARRAWLGGFNLLPYRDRDARAARRRRAGQRCAAILLGVLGVGIWTGGSVWMRARIDAERASIEARLRRQQPDVDAAARAARIAAAAMQRRAQAAGLAAPHREAVDLLALLARIRDDDVRLDALRTTPSGAVLDARAASYRAAARWLARIARERHGWRVDVDALQPATADAAPAGATRMPFRFSIQLRWHDASPNRPSREDRT